MQPLPVRRAVNFCITSRGAVAAGGASFVGRHFPCMTAQENSAAFTALWIGDAVALTGGIFWTFWNKAGRAGVKPSQTRFHSTTSAGGFATWYPASAHGQPVGCNHAVRISERPPFLSAKAFRVSAQTLRCFNTWVLFSIPSNNCVPPISPSMRRLFSTRRGISVLLSAAFRCWRGLEQLRTLNNEELD